MTATDRFYVWAGVNLTGTSSSSFSGELEVEATTSGGFKSQVTFPLATGVPAISSVSPASGAAGTSINVVGTNFRDFQTSSTVTLNGVSLASTLWINNNITATIPTSATSGPVTVIVGGQASNSVPFTVTPPPVITSISANPAPVGASVTITGTNFGGSQGNGAVSFNGRSVQTVTSWSDQSIVVQVPSGATTGNVVVFAPGGVGSNGFLFTVSPPPGISGLFPNSAAPGATVRITGASFGNAQGGGRVAFNGAPAVVTSWSDSVIVATVPAGATTGEVTVTVGAGATSAGAWFPVINPGGLTVDQIVSVDSGGGGTFTTSCSVTTTPFSTAAGNEVLLALVASGGSSTPATAISGGGLTWTLVERSNSTQFGSAEIWRALAPSKLQNASVNVSLSGDNCSLTVISFIGADLGGSNGSGAIGAIATGSSSGAPPSATLVTTRNNSLVLGVASDGFPSSAGGLVAGAGQIIIHQVADPGCEFGCSSFSGDLFWMQEVAQTIASSGTSVTMNDTSPSADYVDMSIVEILPALSPGAGPMVTSLSSSSGPPGTTVTISGVNFGSSQGTSSVVSFNGTPATPSTWSPTSIVVPVPAGATTGNVVVFIAGVDSNPLRFIVTNPVGLAIDQVQTVDAFSAISLATTPFSTRAGNELLLAFVGVGQAAQPVTSTVVSSGGLNWILVQRTNVQGGLTEIWSAYSPFILDNLQVESALSYFANSSLTVVTLLGVDGSSNGANAIGAVAGANAASGAPSISLLSTRANSLAFAVGDDPLQQIARTPGANQTIIHEFVGGDVWIQQTAVPTAGANLSINDVAPTTDPFNLSAVEVRPSPAPVLSSLSPVSGSVGTQVTLTGSNFGLTQGNSTVSFGGVLATPASPAAWSAGSITVPVPSGVSPGGVPVVVVVDGASSNSVPFTVTVPLTIAATASPTPNAAGWNNTDVTISYTCSGGVAPVVCPASQTITAEGAGQIIAASASDAIGQSATASVTLNIDRTSPTITATVTPAPNAQGVVTAPASVSFVCSDARSGIAVCPPPVTLTTAGLNQTISGAATDIAGNLGNTSVTVSVQLASLTVTALTLPPPNAAGWNNSNVAISYACSGGVPPLVCPGPTTVSTAGAHQVITGSAVDAAAQTAFAVVTLSIDQTPPLVSVSSPADGSNVTSGQITVQGQVSDDDSGVASVSCNAAAGVLTAGSFSCPVTLAPGINIIAINSTDVAGNSSNSNLSLNLAIPIKVQITAPTALQLFASNPITVTGTVDTPTATINVGGVTASVTNGTFVAAGVVLREGKNLVTATATSPDGGVGSDSVATFLDTNPPVVHVDSPNEGALVNTPQVDVTGTVNDLVTGTVNGDQVSVSVNGVTARVFNRSFAAQGILLVPGLNTITAVATDRAGNVSQHSVHVTLQSLGSQRSITVSSGNNQIGPIGSVLPQPLVVHASDALGRPLANVILNFAVNKSDGLLISGQQTSRLLAEKTDANGNASVRFRLGTRGGVGINQVAVSGQGFVGQTLFVADSTVGPAAQIHTVSGEVQRGAVGAPLAEPLVVLVMDSGGNPVPDVPVTFTVQSGGGSIDGLSNFTRNTDSDGKASTVLVLGQQAGTSNTVVTATFSGFTGQPAAFTSSSLVPGPAARTTLSGTVLDDANQPIVNATASVRGTNLSALSDANGRFTITHVPVGDLVLFVDGSTSTNQEVYPTLSFQIATVPGIDNALPGPIYLPEIDTDNSQVVGGDQDVVLTMKGVAGVQYKVFAHSVTFPDGSRVGRLTLSQVHADKVPMTPPSGTAPRLVGTLQPAGVKFDPPIQMTLPNTDGLAPGQIVELFSFRHDIEQFVTEGTARVSEDGSVVVSDAGFGLTVSGWHGAAATPPPTTCARSLALKITPSDDFIPLNGNDNLTASITPGDTSACPLSDGTYVWTSSDPTIINVLGAGATAQVSALLDGEATITATFNAGSESATADAHGQSGSIKFEDADSGHCSGFDDIPDPRWLFVGLGGANSTKIVNAKIDSGLTATARLQSDRQAIATLDPTAPRQKTTPITVTAVAAGDTFVHTFGGDPERELPTHLNLAVRDRKAIKILQHKLVMALDRVLIPKGQAFVDFNNNLPVCVQPKGGSGQLHTQPVFPDFISGGSPNSKIVNLTDGICHTQADPADDQVTPVNQGTPDSVCILAGKGNVLHSTPNPTGGNHIVGSQILSGPKGICVSDVASDPGTAPRTTPAAATLQTTFNTAWGLQGNVYADTVRIALPSDLVSIDTLGRPINPPVRRDTIVQFDAQGNEVVDYSPTFDGRFPDFQVDQNQTGKLAALKSKDRSYAINAFYVRQFGPGPLVQGNAALGITTRGSGDSFMADLSANGNGAQSGSDVLSAHEITHALGAHDHNTTNTDLYRQGTDRDLMWFQNGSGTRCRIRKSDVDDVRPL